MQEMEIVARRWIGFDIYINRISVYILGKM